MGGAFSKNKDGNKNIPLYEKIDHIASDYILTSDFKSLQNLKQKEYCTKLVVLTSDILEKFLTTSDIIYLQQKMKKGIENPINLMTKSKVAYLSQEDLNNSDVKNMVKKKRLCIGIAKKYVRVAHIFATIVTAVNPVYSYVDKDKRIVRVPLYKKDEIPPNTNATLENYNICENRIKTLQGIQQNEFGSSEPIIVAPSVCEANAKLDGTPKTLIDEPGIPELMQLYYDKYDYSTGEFVGMTDKTKQIYLEHVKLFHRVFTGKDDDSDGEVNEFADIKLRDYNKKSYCQGNAVTIQKQYSSEHADSAQKELFTKYAEQVKTMMANANKNQSELLGIVDKLFIPFADDKNPEVTHYKVNADLNDVALEHLVKQTRELVIKLFLTCESDYAKGIKIYEAIVQSIIVNVSPSQIENMEEVKSTIIYDSMEPTEEPDAKEKEGEEAPSLLEQIGLSSKEEVPAASEETVTAEEVPASEVEEAPIEEVPVEEVPVEEVPVEEASVEEASVEEVPVEEIPVEEAPVEEASVDEVEEVPVEEAPVEEGPPIEEEPVTILNQPPIVNQTNNNEPVVMETLTNMNVDEEKEVSLEDINK